MKRIAALTGLLLLQIPSFAFASEGSAHAGPGEAASSGLPQFNPEWFPSQIFWLAIAFGLMYLAFSKTILPSIGTVIENRKSHVSNMMAHAESFTKQAKDAQSTYEKTMLDAGLQARQFMLDADLKAKEKAATATEKFRLSSEKKLTDAETSVQTAQKQALADLQTTIADIARSASKKIANIDADQNAVQSAVAEAQKRAKAA